MKTVITYGTFDLFHVGHVRLLQRAKSLGDRLIVGISTDKFNQSKGKRTIIPFEQRTEVVSSCRFVDEVIGEDCWEQKRRDILEYKADIFVMGNDWHGKFDDLSDICKVVYLERTEDISSTSIKTELTVLSKDSLSQLSHALEIASSIAAQLK
ncbi:adenylyltransferase/cytidyltransferase family protein [Massilia timonae]|uniref:adenylyltransferase/cytidyltransferase family protein n=1 Tax=Massilia timonae TaxID=47229 RepID=UPI0028AEF8BC|nr:adenylyltransferase/cytidyltransferase family protein [Massilia timonae]